MHTHHATWSAACAHPRTLASTLCQLCQLLASARLSKITPSPVQTLALTFVFTVSPFQRAHIDAKIDFGVKVVPFLEGASDI